MQFLDPKSGDRLVSAVATGPDDYVFWTTEGYYCATPKAEKLINVNSGGIKKPVAPYRALFRRPDLVARKLAGETIPPPAKLAEDENMSFQPDGQVGVGDKETKQGTESQTSRETDKGGETEQAQKPGVSDLRKGMNPRQVIEMLGKPKQRGGAGKLEIWRYGKDVRLRFQNGKLQTWETPAKEPTQESKKSDEKSTTADPKAEDIYRRAVEMFNAERLHEAKRMVEMLRERHPDAAVLTDTKRDPTVGEIEEAVKDLGNYLTVRQDGRGDHTSIQSAIDAAGPKSLIEIRDSGIYSEQITIGREKSGLTLRGAQGCWPVITSEGVADRAFAYLMRNGASGTKLKQFVLLHLQCAGEHPTALRLDGGSITAQRLVVQCGANGKLAFPVSGHGSFTAKQCLFLGKHIYQGLMRALRLSDCIASGLSASNRFPASLNNVLLTSKNRALWQGGIHAKGCTIFSVGSIPREGTTVSDSIIPDLTPQKGRNVFKNCCVIAKGPPRPLPQLGRGCFRADPMFRDPDNLDYRLHPRSPCRGRASDGGDLGFRYTQSILELLQVAQRLKQKGMLDF